MYAAHGSRYAGYTLRQVCAEMHDFYRQAGIKDLAAPLLPSGELPRAGAIPEAGLRSARGQ